MSDCIAGRVGRHFLTTVRHATIIHRDHNGASWGWLDDDIPRMHLVPLDDESRGHARVWLEDGTGCRSFLPEPGFSTVDFGALREWVSRTRGAIESSWLRTCQRKRWLHYSPSDETITVYQATPHEFRRHLRRAVLVSPFLQVDVSTNTARLKVPLGRIIWRGADDGSDAQ
jgi:hypothetical protein